MIEMDSTRPKKRGVKMSGKLSTKVDMTPMVDLGFLLITFFIFTATMSSPTTMDLYMPKTDGEETPIKRSGVLTILLGQDKIFYYEGQLTDASNLTPATLMTIRDVIIDKKAEIIRNHTHDENCKRLISAAQRNNEPNWEIADLSRDLVIVIKPTSEATYKNTIDILDEMTINDIKRFAIVKITDIENGLMSVIH